MDYKVAPVENKVLDYNELATVVVSNYPQNPYFGILYPNSTSSELIANQALRWGHYLLEPLDWYLKVVDPTTEQIISYSCWTLPKALIAKLEKNFPRPAISDDERHILTRNFDLGSENGHPRGMNTFFVDQCEKQREEGQKSFPKCEHITLRALVTHPAHQGKGAASPHLKWGVKLADEEGLPVFLESTPLGKAVYVKYGFEVVKEVVHDLTLGGGFGTYAHT